MGLLRFILALVVVTGHTSPLWGLRLTGNFVAVQTFFLISGFYMAMILDKKYRGKGSYRLFIGNRLLRLFPAYWVVLCIAFLGSSFNYWYWGSENIFSLYLENPHQLSAATLSFLSMANLGILGQDSCLFLATDSTGALIFSEQFRQSTPQLWSYLFIPQAWSISIELLFYLIAPLFMRRKTSLLLSLLFFSLCLRIFIHKGLHLNFDPWTYRFFPCELGLFVLGGLSYRIYLKLRQAELSLFWQSFLVLPFIACTLSYQWLPGGIALKALYYGLTTLSLPLLFNLSKNWEWDRRIGELSYPIYISHFLFLPSFDGYYWLWPQSSVLEALESSSYYGWVVCACTLIFSWALLRFVIDPIEKLRQSRLYRT